MRLLVALASLSILTTGCHWMQFEHNRTVKRTLTPGSLTQIDVSTFNGSIDVMSHDDTTIELDVKLGARGSSEQQAQEACEKLELNVTETDGQIVIQAANPDRSWSASASATLLIPRDCSLHLRTSNGHISVQNVDGNVKLGTSNGKVLCESVTGTVSAKTSNGTIEVKDCVGAIDLVTSNGPVTYAGELKGSTNSITTSNGRINVSLANQTSIAIKAATSNGSIDCDLESLRVIEKTKRSLHVVAGEGEASEELSIRTSNGSVKIETIQPPAEKAVSDAA